MTEEAFTFIVQYCHVSKKFRRVKLQVSNVCDVLYASQKYLMNANGGNGVTENKTCVCKC